MTIELFQGDRIGISRYRGSAETAAEGASAIWRAVARRVFGLLFCAIVLTPWESNAEVIRKAKLKSALTEVVLPIESVEPVSFWAEMKGNSSNVVNVRVEAPQGTKVEFLGAQVGGRGKAKIEAIGRQAWYPVLLTERYKDGAKEASVFTLRRAGRSIVTQDAKLDADIYKDGYKASSSNLTRATGIGNWDLCSYFSPQQLQAVLEQLKEYTGREWTKDEFCEFAKNPTEEGAVIPGASGGGMGGNGNFGLPTDPTDEAFQANPDNASLDLGGVFRKDACNSRVSKYLIKVTMDFSGVDAARFPQGITVRFRGLENIYKGNRAASIKPVSDGKFAPAPLLLTNSISYDDTINVMKWTKGKPKKVADVDVEDKVYYRGFVLSRSVASSVLNGGYASVDTVSDYQSYGACLNMVRSRQRVNGYPGGD